MKKAYTTLFKIIQRIIYAFEMYPTKNPNVVTGVASTCYKDGTRDVYLGAIHPKELNRKKVKTK